MKGNHSNGEVNETVVVERLIDGETGEVIDEGMFADGEGKMQDGSVMLPKLTMATIMADPERVTRLQRGPVACAILTGIATGTKILTDAERENSYVALVGEFGAVRLDDDGEPAAVYKSDTLFFPIGHDAALAAFERTGRLEFSLKFVANPSSNPRKYSWSYVNLAKLDRSNLSPIDRLLRLSAAASKALLAPGQQSLLSFIRS